MPVSQREGIVDVGDGHKLWYFDTGGDGTPVVFLHPSSGSGLVWGYQQPVFSAAGYRMIGYSRRGYARSIVGDTKRPGIGSTDLLKLIDHLQLDRIHLIGTAAGGMYATDFAVSHSGRLLSLVLANSIVGVTNDDYRTLENILRPKEFYSLPEDFKELCPSYRHLNPEGRRLWNSLHETSMTIEMGGQGFANEVVWDHLVSWTFPVLILTGDADLYTPPSVMRLFHERIPGSECYLIRNCGHSAYWEQPEIFNRRVLEFLERSNGK